jgi:hypothetical protein
MISYQNVEFSVEDVSLTDSIQVAYNSAVILQWKIRNAVIASQALIQNSKYKTMLNTQYWGQNQRFFQQMTTAGKLHTAVTKTKLLVKKGHCVVLSLWKTGEARTKELVSDFKIAPTDGKHISIVKATAEHFVRKYFDPKHKDIALVEGGSERLVALQKELLDCLASADLSCFVNPIDYLKEKLGGRKNVAELTGRSYEYLIFVRPEKNTLRITHNQVGLRLARPKKICEKESHGSR